MAASPLAKDGGADLTGLREIFGQFAAVQRNF
jgi:hypothetical protein